MTTEKSKPGRPFQKGQSGNPKGRPPSGLAIADLARAEVDKHGLVAKLGLMAGCGRGPSKLRALELVLAYAFGRPRSEIDLQHSGSIGRAEDLAKLRAVFAGVLEGFPEAVRIEAARRLLELEGNETHGPTE
jgi:hypothetical protein